MSLWDSFLVVMVLLLVGVSFITLTILYSNFNDALQQDDNIPQIAKDSSEDLNTSLPSALDWIFAALVFGLPLLAMGLAYTNFISDTFFYITIGLMLLMTFFGFAFQDGWRSIVQGSVLAPYAANLPIMNHVLSNIGWYGILFVIIIGYGTYVKIQNPYGGGF